MSKKYKVVEGCLDRSGYGVLDVNIVEGKDKEEILEKVLSEKLEELEEEGVEKEDVFIDGNVVSYFDCFSVVVEEGESVYDLIVDGIEKYNDCDWEDRDLSLESNFNKICDYFEVVGI